MKLSYGINIFKSIIPLNEPQKNLYDLIRSEELRPIDSVEGNWESVELPFKALI